MTKSASKQSNPAYKKGDIVYLITGGPSMAVSDVLYDHRDIFKGEYRCQWFAGKKLDFGIFPEESLTTTNPKP